MIQGVKRSWPERQGSVAADPGTGSGVDRLGHDAHRARAARRPQIDPDVAVEDAPGARGRAELADDDLPDRRRHRGGS